MPHNYEGPIEGLPLIDGQARAAAVEAIAELCPGSDKWGAGEDVLGMGRCEDCGRLILCDSGGILYPHQRKESS